MRHPMAMACGTIDWWRAPDLRGLLQRHGQAEHLVVQFDFLVQPERDGRAEFSIPGASKTGMGYRPRRRELRPTGYADIVSLASHEIWEIKPDRLEDQAADEACWYVSNAKEACGGEWKLGTGFTTSKRQYPPGVVYRKEGNGNRAELHARQGRPGSVLYWWEINGKRQPNLDAYWGTVLRSEIVGDYFAYAPSTQTLPGAKPPNDLPPGKFTSPLLTLDSCEPELKNLIPGLLKSVQTICTPVLFEGGAIAIMLDGNIYNATIARREMARKTGLLGVRPSDPHARLYREALAILTAASVAHVPVVAIGGTLYALSSAPLAVGGVLACTARATTALGLELDGALGALSAGLRAAARGLAAGPNAVLVAFVTPRSTVTNSAALATLDVSLPKFEILTPRQASSVRLGQSKRIDGVEWYVAGVAKAGPTQ